MQKVRTSTYIDTKLYASTKVKQFGIDPEEMIKNELLKKKFAGEAKKIRYLTNRKKAKSAWKKAFSCCIIKKKKNIDEESSTSTDSDDPNKPQEVNAKVIDMMIFSESLAAWQIYDVLVNVTCAVSSYFYLFMASCRNAIYDDEFNS
jgi:hypothetical protein